MRLIKSLAVCLVLATPALAQPAPDMGPPDMAQQGGPPMQSAPRHGGKLAEKFEAANVTHDGRLTREQAATAHFGHIAARFDQIDTAHKGYLTLDDIQSWRRAKHQAKLAQQQQPAPSAQ